MKWIAILLAAVAASAADLTVVTTTDFNVRVVCQPNGPVDGPLAWTNEGLNGIAVDANGMAATVKCDVPGTNVVTVVGASKGVSLTNVVLVVVNPGVPPATTLGVHAETSAK